jgi:hypothetical protein
MAFLGDGRKLTGKNGTIYKGTLGTEIAGDGSTPLPIGTYIVTGVAATTAFPSNTDGAEIRVGDPITVRSGITITPAVDDDVKPLTLSELVDISSWELPFTADTIETTTFSDIVKTYERGKTDAAGSLQGIVTIGTTTDDGGFLNQFIDVVKHDGSTSYDVYVQTEELLIAELVANKESSKGDEISVFAPINIYGASIGAAQDAAQAFTSDFRIASSDDVNLVLYRVSF